MTIMLSARRLFAAILAATATLAAGAPALADTLRIGLANGTSADFAPIFAAEKLGLFKEAGLDVKIIAFRGGAAAQEALSAGAADLIAYFGPAVALAVSKGAKETMVGTVAAGSAGWTLIVPKDSPIQNVRDLDGKSVGISSKASTSDMAALFVADQAKITLRQIPLGAGALIPALRSKQVDSIIFSGVTTMKEISLGRARALVELGETMPPTMADVLVASNDLMTKNPAQLRAALAAIYKGLARLKSDRAYGLAFLKDMAGTENDELTAALYDAIIPTLSSDGHIERQWVENGLSLAARAWDAPELANMDAGSLFTNAYLSQPAAR